MNPQDFVKAGYSRYIDQFKAKPDLKLDPYQGTYQKKFRDEVGVRYVLNIEFWNFKGTLGPKIGLENQFHSWMQFDNASGDRIQIELFNKKDRKLADVEFWAENSWIALSGKHSDDTV